MKSNIWKSTFREIKQSFGRFMAIFAITALGVSLFSGLKVLQPAMVKTTDKYFMEKELYDYRVMSNMGFEKPDLEFLASQEEVRIAEGIVSFDMLCYMEGESEKVIQIYNVPERMNNMELLYGRMPKSSKECIVDSAMYGEDSIGKKICLSTDNDEDDLENFSVKEYEVVGVAQSSNYIQFERGNTSKGNGKIAGFMYIPKDAFDVEFYTEILVKFDEDYQIYSDEYDSYMDEKEPVWEKIAEEAAKNRHERIVAEATEELEDAKKEFAEEKADAEAELEDARIELADAYKELTDASKELADAKKELADGRKTLEEAREELTYAEYEIGYNRHVTLPAAEKEIEENYNLLCEKSAELSEGKKQLEAAQAELDQKSKLIYEFFALQDQVKLLQLNVNNLSDVFIAQNGSLNTKQENELKSYEIATSNILSELNPEAPNYIGQGMLQQRIGILSLALKEIDSGLEKQAIDNDILGNYELIKAGQAEIDKNREILESGEKQIKAGLKMACASFPKVKQNC